MMKKGIVALLLIASVPFFVHAYVSPGKPTGYVNDFANVIPASTKANLEKTLSDFEKKTGDEVVIVTVPSLGGDDEVSYGVKLFEEWGIGKKGKDNGVLILNAPNERRIRIEVGYGLEQYLTDAKASSIYRNIMAPAFKNGDYAGGFTDGVNAVMGALEGQVDAVPSDSSSQSGGGNWFAFLFIIPLWLASILGRSKSWWLGGVLGAIGGIVIGFVYGFMVAGIIAIPVLVVLGLLFDFIVSKSYASRITRGLNPPWWIGGGRGGGFGGGGFGGFGGGGSGGGGGGGGY